MTAVNNQQVNSFLKLTQINRQNIDTSKSVDNKNILNNFCGVLKKLSFYCRK